MTTSPFDGSAYGSGIDRSSTRPDPLVPEPMVAQIIQELPTQSAALRLCHRTTMSALTVRQPVLSLLPVAYFVNSGSTPGGGDYALHKTTAQKWKGVELVAEEIATTVVVPNAYFDDSAMDIWAEVRPRLVEAFGALVDGAVFFGENIPGTWASGSIYAGAVAAGNIVHKTGFTVSGDSPTLDWGKGITQAGKLLKKQGYPLNGFAAAPGFGWEVAGLRGSTGQPLYTAPTEGAPASLYGFPLQEVDNASFDAASAALIGGSWNNAIIGIRKDMSFSVDTTGVIQDDTGAIVYNLLQQRLTALTVTMRLGFATANPTTKLAAKRGGGFPFVVVEGDAALT